MFVHLGSLSASSCGAGLTNDCAERSPFSERPRATNSKCHCNDISMTRKGTSRVPAWHPAATWAGEDSNLRRRQPTGLQPVSFGHSDTDPQLARLARPRTPVANPRLEAATGTLTAMPTFDIVSEVDMQEVRNAVDQANREAATRFDFKNTDSGIDLGEGELVLRSSTEDRLRALHQVLDEKLVKRQVSLKAFEDSKVEEAQKGTARQKIAIRAGISADHAKRLNKFIKELGLKGVSSQTQGDQLRVTGKKRDDLQAVISACKGEDFGIPLQFDNFRD